MSEKPVEPESKFNCLALSEADVTLRDRERFAPSAGACKFRAKTFAFCVVGRLDGASVANLKKALIALRQGQAGP